MFNGAGRMLPLHHIPMFSNGANVCIYPVRFRSAEFVRGYRHTTARHYKTYYPLTVVYTREPLPHAMFFFKHGILFTLDILDACFRFRPKQLQLPARKRMKLFDFLLQHLARIHLRIFNHIITENIHDMPDIPPLGDRQYIHNIFPINREFHVEQCSLHHGIRPIQHIAQAIGVGPLAPGTDTIGLPTLKDIMAELARPGRDPREQFESFSFADGVEKIEDVIPGMKLPGVVTNITAFGAFIDIGVHQDGLAHISQLSDRYIKDPNEAVKVNQKVMATVLEVDVKRKRISLSLKKDPDRPKQDQSQLQPKQERQPAKPKPDINALQQAFVKNRT